MLVLVQKNLKVHSIALLKKSIPLRYLCLKYKIEKNTRTRARMYNASCGIQRQTVLNTKFDRFYNFLFPKAIQHLGME